MELVWIIFILSQLADVVTTQFALTSGRAHEANPLLARIIDRFGLGWIVIKLVVAVIAARMLDAQGHEWAIWVVSAGFFALSWHNVRVTK